MTIPFYGTLIFWAGLLFGGFVFGKPNADQTKRIPTLNRLGSSLALVLAGWSLYFLHRGTLIESYALLVALGMTAGFVGDLFMAVENIIGGMGAFGVGHILYSIAFLGGLQIVRTLNPETPAVFAPLAVWLVIGVVAWYVIMFRGKTALPQVMRFAGLGYALLLTGMAGVAWSLAFSVPPFFPLAIGAALFVISDLIIAGQIFAGWRFPLIGDLIWLTYGPAQALIVLSVGTARVLALIS
ncbi:MAG TPA: lysoplasmalogenase [Aggregatilineales bacterium]|nr:lysoplasmalogenase [Anaerolineales bacterium]HRE49199.1 lysoplasmalogenase [Aggregatilineales bacterium]